MASAYEQLQELYDMDYAEIVEKYTQGRCMFLAAALHYTYGLPIEAAWVHELLPGASGTILIRHRDVFHCWVVLPDGQRFDILGPRSFDAMTDVIVRHQLKYNWRAKIATVTIEELELISDETLPQTNQEVQDAMDAFDTRTSLVRLLEIIIERYEQ